MAYAQSFGSVRETAGSVTLLLVLAIAVHVLDIFTRLSGAGFGFYHPMIFVYGLLAILAAAALSTESVPFVKKFEFTLGLSAIAYFLPFINKACVLFGTNICQTDTFFGVTLNAIVHFIVIFWPVWPLYLMYSVVSRGTKAYTIGSIYAVLWFILLIATMWQTPAIHETMLSAEINVPGFQPGLTVQYLWNIIKDTSSDAYNSIKGLPGKIKVGTERFMKMATGDYYTSKVDAKAKQQLGVWLEQVRLAEPKAYADKPATITGRLRANVFDMPLDITLRCAADAGQEPVTGRITPGIALAEEPEAALITVEQTAEEYFDCVFDAGELEKGSRRINVSAEFDFKTRSYLITYMMDDERLRQARRTKRNPLSAAGITNQNPIAVFTRGPVKIGMGMGRPPVGVMLDRPGQRMRLGLSVENLWLGEIQDARALTIMLPKGMRIKDINGRPVGEPTGCASLLDAADQANCRDSVFEVYVLEDPELLRPLRGLKPSEFVSLGMLIEVDDPQRLLSLETKTGVESVPLAEHYLHAHLDYTYRITRRLNIAVNKPQGETA